MLKKVVSLIISVSFCFSVMPFLDSEKARSSSLTLPVRSLPVRIAGIHHLQDIYGLTEQYLSTVDEYIAVIVVPITYTDLPMTRTTNELHELFFGADSVSNYYYQNSFGRLRLTGHVLPPINLTNARAFYATDSPEYTNFVFEAGYRLSNYVYNNNWMSNVLVFSNRYDRNGDGFFDAVVYVHAGEGRETSIDLDDIHSHAWSYYKYHENGISMYIGNSLYLGRYLVVPEIMNNGEANPYHESTIGTYCHEFGHILGLPDIYNTTATNGGTIVGNAALMDFGGYNYYSNEINIRGRLPAPVNGYFKNLLGWINLTTLDTDSPVQEYILDDYSVSNDMVKAYKLQGYYSHEYWILENRNMTGFDQGLKYPGMLIWHINEKEMHWNDSFLLISNYINRIGRGITLEESEIISPPLGSWPLREELTNASFWADDAAGFSALSAPDSDYFTSFPSKIGISFISAPGSNMTFFYSNINYSKSDTLVVPNPFNPVTDSPVLITISGGPWSDPPAKTTFYICTPEGDLVQEITAGTELSYDKVDGECIMFVKWNGRDMNDRLVNPGLYYYRVFTSDGSGAAGRFAVDYD